MFTLFTRLPYWRTKEVFQHGSSTLGSIILHGTFQQISQLWDNAHTLNLAGLVVGCGEKSQILRDFQGQIRGKNGQFRGNFTGIFKASFAEKRLLKNGRFRESFASKLRWKAISFALILGKFSMKLHALIGHLLRLHTATWNRTLQVSLLNIIKTNKRIRILKTHLLFYLLRRVSSLSNCMLFASPSKFCVPRFFIFLTSEAHFSALEFGFQVGSHSVFIVRTRNGLFVSSWERAWTLLILQVFRHYHSWNEPFRKRSSSL